MRLFVAIDIPEGIRMMLAQACEPLKAAEPRARWVRPESMHLTLKFIGEQPEEKAEAIQTALAKVRRPAAIGILVGGLSFFPYMRFPTVLAAHVQTQPIVNLPDSPLVKIVEQIDSLLTPLGIQREKRAYRVHLTVARIDPRGDHRALAAALEQGPVRADFGAFQTSEFHLYSSQLQRGGAVYTKLATFPFVETR